MTDNTAYIKLLGERIKEHKYRYYILDLPVINDWEYDRLERVYESLCGEAGIEPEASNMVGFSYEKAQDAADRVNNNVDNYSLWLKEMKPVWDKLGLPRSWIRKGLIFFPGIAKYVE